MKPHEERVIAEKDELREKLIKLDEFMHTDTFGDLYQTDQELLMEQREHMANYLEVLHLRIERFRQ